MKSLSERLDSFAEAWRPEQKGDKLIGEVVDVDLRHSDYGDPYPVVTVLTDEGTELAFHAFHTVARNELAKKRPQVGDRIGIAYHGTAEPAKPGMNGAQLYRIIVERDEQPAAVDWSQVATTDEDEPEPAAVANEPEPSSAQLGPDEDLPF